MINLLPDNTKQQLKAARVNVILLRYTFIIALAFAFIVLVFIGSHFLLSLSKSSSEELIASNDTKAQAFSQTQAEIAALSGNLSVAKSVLDQQVDTAKLLRALGQVMPAGTVLESIALNETAYNGAPLNLKVYAASTDATVGLRDQFQSNPVFTNVNLASISESDGIPGYPVSATISLTINRAAL